MNAEGGSCICGKMYFLFFSFFSFFFLGEEKKIIIRRSILKSEKRYTVRIKLLVFCVINAIYCLATLASFL